MLDLADADEASFFDLLHRNEVHRAERAVGRREILRTSDYMQQPCVGCRGDQPQGQRGV